MKSNPETRNPKLSDEYNWPVYTKEYSEQLQEIKEKDQQHFFVENYALDYNKGKLSLRFKDNLHPNWMELYSTAFDLQPTSIFECGCGAGYHLKNLHTIMPKTYISGCDLLQSQLDLAKTFSDLPDTIYERLRVIDFTEPLNRKPFTNNIGTFIQPEFVFSQAVVMHLSTENAIKFLTNMRNLSSKYVMLIEGVKNHENWNEMVAQVFEGWDMKFTNKYIYNGILLTKPQ